MIVSINQPAYLPWLGYFHRIAISDLHIVLDHVQFEKNSYSNRNKVRTPSGSCLLTVPLKTKGSFGELQLDKIEIAEDHRWKAKHLATLSQNYARSRYYSNHARMLEHWYRHTWVRLGDLVREMTIYQLEALGIRTPILYSSEMGVEGSKDELVVNVCKKVGTTSYISGPFGRDYLRPELFAEAGIDIVFHDYVHPIYPQLHPGFESFLATIDLMFNCGPDSLRLMRTGNEEIEAFLRAKSSRSGQSNSLTAIKVEQDDSRGRDDLAMENPTRVVSDRGEAIDSLLSATTEARIHLRPALLDDARLLWEWVNDSSVRASAFNIEFIPWADHFAWISKKLADPRCLILLGVDQHGVRIGQVRIDKTTQGEAFIDVSVDGPLRGRGFGTNLINIAVQKIFAEKFVYRIHAQIKVGNGRSQRAFQRAGFSMVNAEIVNGEQIVHLVREAINE